MKGTKWLAVGGVVAGLAACGGGGGGGGASCTPTGTADISISASAVSPANVCVLPNGVVTFHNADAAVHRVTFPGSCATPVSATPVTTPVPAQASAGVTFPATVENCSYSVDDSTSAALQGTVAVTQATVTGGY